LDTSDPFGTLDTLDPLEAEYAEKMEQNRETLLYNLQVIETMLKGEAAMVAAYPCLRKWFTSHRISNGSKWKALHEEALKHPRALSDKNGRPIFFASYQFLADTHGGQKKTWSKFIPMLSLFGLVEIIQPKEQGNRNTRTQNKSVRIMHEKQADNKPYKHPINYYHLPRYTEALLAKAEASLIFFIEKGGNVGGFGKPMLIDIYGQSKANKITDNYWKKTENQLAAEQVIEDVLTHLLQQKGYVTRGEVMQAVTQSTDMSKRAINTLYSRYMPVLKEKYQLKKQRLSKQKQTEIGISSNKGFVDVITQIAVS